MVHAAAVNALNGTETKPQFAQNGSEQNTVDAVVCTLSCQILVIFDLFYLCSIHQILTFESCYGVNLSFL